MTLKLAVSRSRPPVPYGANFIYFYPSVLFFLFQHINVYTHSLLTLMCVALRLTKFIKEILLVLLLLLLGICGSAVRTVWSTYFCPWLNGSIECNGMRVVINTGGSEEGLSRTPHATIVGDFASTCAWAVSYADNFYKGRYNALWHVPPSAKIHLPRLPLLNSINSPWATCAAGSTLLFSLYPSFLPTLPALCSAPR